MAQNTSDTAATGHAPAAATGHALAVVDGNSLLHRAFHALPETMTAPDGRPTNAAFGFVSMLIKLISDLQPDGVVVAFDRGKPAFRTEALAQYKMQRPPTADALRVQFPMVKKLVEAMDLPIVEIEGYEGDDILGTLACQAEKAGSHVLLVTGDRDAFQLVTKMVSVVTTKKGLTEISVMGPLEVKERYGITPTQIPDYLGLKGDTSDNIPGVPGIGEKTAARLLGEWGTLEAVIEAAKRGEVRGRAGTNLIAHEQAAYASRAVATIACDAPVTLDPITVRFGTFDPAVVARAFGELRFTALLERFLALGAPGTFGADATSSAPGADGASRSTPASSTSARIIVGSAADALETVRAWTASSSLVSSAGGRVPLGVAFGPQGDTLFAEEPPLAVAAEKEVALVAPEAAADALAILAGSACFAAADCKALLQHIIPADSVKPCSVDSFLVSGERLSDVGVAAYLLESSRSSYEVGALYPDYMGVPLPEAALGASAVTDLIQVLEERLEADGSSEVYRRIEMPLIPVLLRMERVGVGLDAAVLGRLSHETQGEVDSLRAQIHGLAGTEFLVDSPKQLAEVLFERLGLPPQKKKKTGYSTDAGVLAALAPLHPIAEKIIAYRELVKLRNTYIDALPRLVGEDGRLHTSFNQTVAATGRLSSSAPNLQNIPVRTELGRRIRAAFVPSDSGRVLIAADYSQIELRILAHLSGDGGLIDAFTSGIDFHTATAARVFGIPSAEVTPPMRQRAKAVNFGIVYGISAHGLAPKLGVGNAEAQATIDRYYAAYPEVRRYLDDVVAQARRDGHARTLYGRKRRIPELASSNYNLRAFGERTAMNHPMQGTAADIMKLAMIEADRRLQESGLTAKMVLQVHDELVFEAPEAETDAVFKLVRDAMSGVAQLAVPLEVSVGSGSDWASAK